MSAINKLEAAVRRVGSLFMIQPIKTQLPHGEPDRPFLIVPIQVQEFDAVVIAEGLSFTLRDPSTGQSRTIYLHPEQVPAIESELARMEKRFTFWTGIDGFSGACDLVCRPSDELTIVARQVHRADRSIIVSVGDDRPELGRTPVTVSMDGSFLPSLRWTLVHAREALERRNKERELENTAKQT